MITLKNIQISYELPDTHSIHEQFWEGNAKMTYWFALTLMFIRLIYSESKPLISIWLKLQEAYGKFNLKVTHQGSQEIPASAEFSTHKKSEIGSILYAIFPKKSRSFLRWKLKSQTHWFDSNQLWNADHCCHPKVHFKNRSF